MLYPPIIAQILNQVIYLLQTCSLGKGGVGATSDDTCIM